MRIYVASSWRNDYQPDVVRALREVGHCVYDFRNPGPGDDGFRWTEIDPFDGQSRITGVLWGEYDATGLALLCKHIHREQLAHQWTVPEFVSALEHPIACRGFDSDFSAMQWADACVLVLPCGRSAHLEAGWFVGQQRPLLILGDHRCEPELMYKMATGVYAGLGELLLKLQEIEDRAFRACANMSFGQRHFAAKMRICHSKPFETGDEALDC